MTARVARADARRNREILLSAAAEVFAADGAQSSMEEIARRAGVGIGTLYRNFRTREDLAIAVHRHVLDQLVEDADRLLAEMAPADALRAWMLEFVDVVAMSRGVAAAVKSLIESEPSLFVDSKEQLRLAAERLLAAGVQAGTVRSDVDAADVLRSVGGVCMSLGGSGEPADAARLVRLIFDGLRYGIPAVVQPV